MGLQDQGRQQHGWFGHGFHESTLVGISRQGHAINLSLDDVLIDGARRTANVTIAGVSGILRDGLPIEEIHMEEGDAEIFSLRQEVGHVLLIVEWNDFAEKRHYTAAYRLLGGTIAVDAASSSGT